jgi:hypothetical protein
MIDIFGADLGLGYDIRCHFKTTINKSLDQKHAQQATPASLAHSMAMPTTDSASYPSWQPMLRDLAWRTWRIVSGSSDFQMPLQAQLDIPVSSINVRPLWSIQDTWTPFKLTKTLVCTLLSLSYDFLNAT